MAFTEESAWLLWIGNNPAISSTSWNVISVRVLRQAFGRDIQMDYERNFAGMTSHPTELAVLLETRDRMIKELHASLDADERRFLLSLVKAEPEWELLGIPHVSELPAVRWKLQNLARLQRERAEQFELQYTILASRFHQ